MFQSSEKLQDIMVVKEELDKYKNDILRQVNECSDKGKQGIIVFNNEIEEATYDYIHKLADDLKVLLEKENIRMTKLIKEKHGKVFVALQANWQ